MGRVKEPEATYVVDQKGLKKAVILSVDEYDRLMEDLADLSAIAARKTEKTVSWEQVKRRQAPTGFVSGSTGSSTRSTRKRFKSRSFGFVTEKDVYHKL